MPPFLPRPRCHDPAPQFTVNLRLCIFWAYTDYIVSPRTCMPLLLLFLNTFMKHWLILAIFGLQHYKSMFTVFRSDRQRARGDGVCLLINKHIKTVQVQLQNSPSDVDMLCIDLLFCQPYRMFVVYSPPSVPSELVTMSGLVRCLEDNCNRLRPTLIVGDFNCPQIDWSKMLAPCS